MNHKFVIGDAQPCNSVTLRVMDKFGQESNFINCDLENAVSVDATIAAAEQQGYRVLKVCDVRNIVNTLPNGTMLFIDTPSGKYIPGDLIAEQAGELVERVAKALAKASGKNPDAFVRDDNCKEWELWVGEALSVLPPQPDAQQIKDMAMLIRRLVRLLPKDSIASQAAMGYLKRKNLLGSPLREDSLTKDEIISDSMKEYYNVQMHVKKGES